MLRSQPLAFYTALLGLTSCWLGPAIGQAGDDMFSAIAARQADYGDRNLVETPPPKLDVHLLPMDAAGVGSAFTPMEKMSTAEQMHDELLRQRERWAPFLKDLAPAMPETRTRETLGKFQWRLDTDADRKNFAGTLAGEGSWEDVTIPHFGGPLGRAASYYRTTFDVSQAMLDRGALFVHFNGVDYKAQVFVNGALVGTHEGLFAPFEFEFTQQARVGQNVLLVKVINDYTMLANSDKGYVFPSEPEYQGDKICASVGPSWDDPEIGWHHCPPGMGIYQDVTIEARPRIHVHDIFVRPLSEDGEAEAWIELFDCDYKPQKAVIEVVAFGQNFTASPSERCAEGRAEVTVAAGVNYYKIPLAIADPRLWTPDTPWLYQLQVRVTGEKGDWIDAAKRQFGLRTFRMETVEEPKGRMYLNGQRIKLRGANTQGGFIQCVMRKDWQQLIDDILLAKMTNMNYIRLTQRPVQPEIYDYCDRLGLMLQTDLPMFAQVRRNQFCEIVREAEEMERLVRSHPSNIMVTYINEPSPRARGCPERNMTRDEMTHLFESCDFVVYMANPDRVRKAVDGDYDPPGPGMPDNHCYNLWYNGHGLDFGALHKGYWQRVKPGWGFGCGEFGAEGLDSVELMRKYYPKSWLPQTPEEEKTWSPLQIVAAQTPRMHYYFFETPKTLADWVRAGREHQAWAMRVMTEAFRRDNRMQSCAIHLFVDVFPDGWMKAILDYERQPKPAWFAYRDALAPLAVNLRSDHRAFFDDEPIEMEAWLCNDRADAPAHCTLHYQLECDGRVIQAGTAPASVPSLAAAYQGSLRFAAPKLGKRAQVTARLGLLDASGKVLHDAALPLDVLPHEDRPLRRIYVVGDPQGKAAKMAASLGATPVFTGPMESTDAIVIDDMAAFQKIEADVVKAVQAGAHAILLNLPKGDYTVGSSKVTAGDPPAAAVFGCSLTGIHFVSRDTGHPLVAGFEPDDFKFWYNASLDRISPLLNLSTFSSEGWSPILKSFEAMAVGSKSDGKGLWCICQIELADRIAGNPVAETFARRLLAGDSPASP